MKKSRLVVALCILLFTSNSFPQENPKQHFIYTGIGTLSAPEIVSKFVDVWLVALTAGYSGSDTRSAVPAVSLGYQFYQSDRYSFGGSITYEKLVKDVAYGARNAGRIEAVIASPMLEVRYEYASSESFGACLSLGVGAAFISSESNYDGKSESLSKTILAAQFEPVGLRFGKRFIVHAGLGFGMKGLLTCSVGYRF